MTVAPSRRVELKIRRPVWNELEHPRDRVGKFIETLAEVRVWGGIGGTVLRNVGGGRLEIVRSDGKHVIVHRNYLTVVARPDGSAPTDQRSDSLAPLPEMSPSAQAVPGDPDATPTGDATEPGARLRELLLDVDSDMATLVAEAAADYQEALGNGIPDDEADERGGLLAVLDSADVQHGADDPEIGAAIEAVRQVVLAEPDAPAAPADLDERIGAAIAEAEAAGDAMSAGVLAVARSLHAAGNDAGVDNLITLGTNNDRPSSVALRAAWGALVPNAKPVYDGSNDGGGDDGQDRRTSGTPLADAPANRVQGDQGQGDVLPRVGGRGGATDRRPDGLPGRSGPENTGRGLRDDDGTPEGGPVNGRVPGAAGPGAGGTGDDSGDREPGGSGARGGVEGVPGRPERTGDTGSDDTATGADQPVAPVEYDHEAQIAKYGEEVHRNLVGNGDAHVGHEWRVVEPQEDDPLDADGTFNTSPIESDTELIGTMTYNGGRWEARREGAGDAVSFGATAREALDGLYDAEFGEGAAAYAREHEDDWKRGAIAADVAGFAGATGMTEVVTPEGTPVDVESVLGRLLSDVDADLAALNEDEAQSAARAADDEAFSAGAEAAAEREAAAAPMYESDISRSWEYPSDDFITSIMDQRVHIRWGDDEEATGHFTHVDSGSYDLLFDTDDGNEIEVDSRIITSITEPEPEPEPEPDFEPTWGVLDNDRGAVRRTNGDQVSGWLHALPGSNYVNVYDKEGNLTASIMEWEIAGVRVDRKPVVAPSEVDALTDDQSEPTTVPDVDGDELQPAAATEVNLNRIHGTAFQPPADENLTPAGKMGKLDANIAALRTLRELQREGRNATPEEQGILAQWAGWGGLPEVFDDEAGGPTWATRRAELRGLLSEAEWNEARRNTLNAHYTDPRVVSAVWRTMQGLGFDGGRVLEPGSGSGTFIGLAPENTSMVGVELDSTTAALSKYLYPQAQIRNESFAATTIPDGSFDATVGNVPFGRFALTDRIHNPTGESIHNHFILKSLALTRPGGLMGVLSSRFTLDSQNDSARRKMYEQADLIGAVRLPTGSHQRASGTDVIEDILIFRKRPEGAEPGDDSWVTASKQNVNGFSLPVSNYFTEHPENILGEMTAEKGRFGTGDLVVRGDRDMPTLAATLDRIAAEGREAGLAGTTRPDEGDPLPELIAADSGRHPGQIQQEEDGSFTQNVNGASVPFTVPTKQAPELAALIGLRDSLTALLDAETATTEDTDEIATLREDLNTRYDAFLAKYGPINRYKLSSNGRRTRPGQGGFRRDPMSAVVRALETYDPSGEDRFPDGFTGSVKKASIFNTRSVRPREIATTADNPADALTLSMDTYGEVNLPAIAEMLGVSEDEARGQLRGLVFEVPTDPSGDMDRMILNDALAMAGMDNPVQTYGTALSAPTPNEQPGMLVPAAQYLSGNVRRKLATARIAAAEDPRFEENVDALKGVIPEDLGPEEIDGRLGAAWIGPEVIEDFIADTLSLPPYARRQQVKVRTSGGGIWTVEAPKWGVGPTSTWGTEDRDFGSLVQSLLEQRSIKITRKVGDKTVQDLDATLAAQAKAEAIQDRFTEWLWEDPERARTLQARYNEQFNAIALRKYDGQGRAFPGMAATWKPHAHVKDAVERIVNEPTALLAHVVGAGKTAEMVMGAAELKRLGLANKPAIVVPNHMLEQFTREYLEIYPAARLLAAGSDDLTGPGRREFVARAAVGDWDAVILTQGAFESIPMSPREQEAYIDREMATLRAQLEDARSNNDGSKASKRTVKKMEAALVRAEEQLKKKLDKTKDVGVSFEQTGIDYLMVDEAHQYSNLRTLSNIQGAGAVGSDRATDLHMKMEYLRANTKSGRVATFATGTPIRNTVTQAYVMQKYLRPDLLEEAGIHSFDQWAATFGSTVDEMELKPEGSGFRQTTRFAKFRNVPELLRMFHTFADVKLAEDLNLPTPNLNGGKVQTVSVPRTNQLADYIANLGERADAVRAGRVEPEDDNMLKISTDGRKAALSMELVGGQHEPGKIETAADRIHTVYEQNKNRVYTDPKTGVDEPTPGALQIVFLDMGTPKTGSADSRGVDDVGDWNGYDKLKAELVQRGVPAEGIRYIHEAKNDAQKAELFAAARSGRISVLIGSSEKMGVGTNMQRRAVALHHLDAPWRPADVEQRDGRIMRQGNLNPDVDIYRYVTEGSFDAYMWQTLERKAKFINQIMRGSLDVREIEDVGDTAMSYAEVKAIATGNPDLLEMAKADTLLTKLQRLERTHAKTQVSLRADMERHTVRAARMDEVAAEAGAAAERATYRPDEANTFAVNGVAFPVGGEGSQRTDAAAALRTALANLRQEHRYSYRDSPEVSVGTFGGFNIMAQVVNDPWNQSERVVQVWLDGVPNVGPLGGVHKDLFTARLRDLGEGGGGWITRMENAITSLPRTRERAITDAAESRSEVAKAEERLGTPFARGGELAAIRRRHERLAEKIRRDERRRDGEDVEFDPRIDTDQFDDPIVRGAATPVEDTVPEVPPARAEVLATSLSVNDQIEFVLRDVSGETAVGTVANVRQVGAMVFVTITTSDGQSYTRAFGGESVVTKINGPEVKRLRIRGGKVVVEVKRLGGRGKFREADHPRDSEGRFVETGAEVRMNFGGGVGKIVSMAGGGRIKVERSDGKTVVVDAGNVTVTKKPNGQAVGPQASPQAPAAPATARQAVTGASTRPGTRPAPDASPEGATETFTGSNGERAWLDTSEGRPVGYMQTDPSDPGSTVRFDDAQAWASAVDDAGMEHDGTGLPNSAAGRPPRPDDAPDPEREAQMAAAFGNGPTVAERAEGKPQGSGRVWQPETDDLTTYNGADLEDAYDSVKDPARRAEITAEMDRRRVAAIPETRTRRGADLSDAALAEHLNTNDRPADAKAVHEATSRYARAVLSGDEESLAANRDNLNSVLDRIENGDDAEAAALAREMRANMEPEGDPDASGTPQMDAAIAAIGNKGKPDATGTVDDPIDVQGDLDLAARLLSEDKHIRLNRVDEVGTLLDKLGEEARRMEAAGQEAQPVDLCKVSVPKTNLFCQQSKGIPRAQMPQLSGRPLPGSPADSMPRNARGRVNITGPFIDRLTSAGIKVEDETVPASTLKASQNQLNGTAVALMMKAMRDGTMPDDRAIFITRDNYVVDGHHQWASKVGIDTEDGELGDVEMKVRRIDMEIGAALDYANAFSAEQGIAQAVHGQPAIPTVLAKPGKGAPLSSNAQALAAALAPALVEKSPDLGDRVTQAAADYDEAIAGDDTAAKVRAHMGLAEVMMEVANTVDTGGDEPERAAALDAAAGVNGLLDTNVSRLFPPAAAGGTPPDLDDPVIDEGTVGDMMGNAGREDITDGGSAAAFLVKGEDGQWRLTKERQALHDAILDSILDGLEPSDDPKYNFFGGGPASGKGSITRMFPHLEEDSAYINADEIKAVLPEMGQRLRAGDPSAAGFTHEESSYLAKRIQQEGFNRKVNVTLDGTGDSSEAAVRKKINAARKAGYKVDAYYVSVPAEVALQRAIDRAANGTGADRGRTVPESVILHTHAAVSQVLPKVMDDFDSMVLFDTNVPFGTPPNVIARKDAIIGSQIVSPGAWQAFLDKANGLPAG